MYARILRIVNTVEASIPTTCILYLHAAGGRQADSKADPAYALWYP